MTTGAGPDFPKYNVVTIAGPGITKEIKRKLLMSPMDDEQRDYLDHKGAYDPHARVHDLEEWCAPGDAVRRLMGGNAARFFGIEQR